MLRKMERQRIRFGPQDQHLKRTIAPNSRRSEPHQRCRPHPPNRSKAGKQGLRALRQCRPYEPCLHPDPILPGSPRTGARPVSYTHLRAHETDSYLVCRLLLEKKKKIYIQKKTKRKNMNKKIIHTIE